METTYKYCAWPRTDGSEALPQAIVPVQREQCRRPIRARILRRFGLAEGSSLRKADMVPVAIVIGLSIPGAGEYPLSNVQVSERLHPRLDGPRRG
jgi:hypothetical protein